MQPTYIGYVYISTNGYMVRLMNIVYDNSCHIMTYPHHHHSQVVDRYCVSSSYMVRWVGKYVGTLKVNEKYDALISMPSKLQRQAQTNNKKNRLRLHKAHTVTIGSIIFTTAHKMLCKFECSFTKHCNNNHFHGLIQTPTTSFILL